VIVSAGHFAVEYELIDMEGEPLRIAYWFRVNGQTLGRTDVASSFDCVAAELALLLRHTGNRRDDLLASKPHHQLFDQVQIGLMIDFDPWLDPGKDWERHLRFVALPPSAPAFDGWTAFLVENGNVAHFVWHAADQHHEIFECVFARGDFEAALHAFQAELSAHLNARRSLPPISGQRPKLAVRDTG
jgi:hypothetical protein